MQSRWTIDVCVTCGRLAQFPFCEHRDEPRSVDEGPWCMPVVVRPAWPGEFRAMMGRSARARARREARVRRDQAAAEAHGLVYPGGSS